MDAVNLNEKLSRVKEYWSPKIVGEVNDSYVKVVKFKSEFVWHHHENEDEMFLVLQGRMRMKFRDRDVIVSPGEFIIVPKGVEHMPVAEEEVHVLLFEPKTTLNTGNVRNERTLATLERHLAQFERQSHEAPTLHARRIYNEAPARKSARGGHGRRRLAARKNAGDRPRDESRGNGIRAAADEQSRARAAANFHHDARTSARRPSCDRDVVSARRTRRRSRIGRAGPRLAADGRRNFAGGI